MPAILLHDRTATVPVTGASTSLVPVLVSSLATNSVVVSHINDNRAHTHGPTTLTPVAAAIATPCDVASFFAVTLTDPSTELSNPIGAPIDGQKIMWQLTQGSGGSKALTFGTKFGFSTDLPEPLLSTTAGAIDYLGAMYVQAADAWRVIAFLRGFA